jgi:hypothetical protein
MIFNNLQTFNNTLTLMITGFNKYQGKGPIVSAIASVLSGQNDVKTLKMEI